MFALLRMGIFWVPSQLTSLPPVSWLRTSACSWMCTFEACPQFLHPKRLGKHFWWLWVSYSWTSWSSMFLPVEWVIPIGNPISAARRLLAWLWHLHFVYKSSCLIGDWGKQPNWLAARCQETWISAFWRSKTAKASCHDLPRVVVLVNYGGMPRSDVPLQLGLTYSSSIGGLL